MKEIVVFLKIRKFNSRNKNEWEYIFDNPNFIRNDIVQTGNENYIIIGTESSLTQSKPGLLVLDAKGKKVSYNNRLIKNKNASAVMIKHLKNSSYAALFSVNDNNHKKMGYTIIKENGEMIYHRVTEKKGYNVTPYTIMVDNSGKVKVSGMAHKAGTYQFYYFTKDLGDLYSHTINYQQKLKSRMDRRRKFRNRRYI